MNRTDLATVALGAYLLNLFTGAKLYKGAAITGAAVAAAKAPDAPPMLVGLVTLIRKPVVQLLGESECCESCASRGPCAADKPREWTGPINSGKKAPVVDAEFVAVPS